MLKTVSNPVLLTLIASASVLTLGGCGKPNNSLSNTLPPFGITMVNKQALAAVNCKITEESKIACDKPKEDKKVSKLENLKRQQKLAADRQIAIDKVEESIRQAMKIQKFDPAGPYNPQKIDESLVTESANQQTESKSLKDQSASEQKYQNISAYHCESTHSRGGVSISNVGELLFATPTPLKIKDEVASFVAKVEVQQPNNSIFYVLSDREDASQQKSVQSVQTDSEFIFRTYSAAASTQSSVLQTQESAQSSMNCAHIREIGSALPFSDRIEDETQYSCVVNSTANGTVTSSAMLITVLANQKDQDQFYPNQRQELAGGKFAVRTTAVNGLLTISVDNLQTKNVASEVTIPNAARNLHFSVEGKDVKGSINRKDINGADVTCAAVQ